jgi:hypothetical protein
MRGHTTFLEPTAPLVIEFFKAKTSIMRAGDSRTAQATTSIFSAPYDPRCLGQLNAACKAQVCGTRNPIAPLACGFNRQGKIECHGERALIARFITGTATHRWIRLHGGGLDRGVRRCSIGAGNVQVWVEVERS